MCIFQDYQNIQKMKQNLGIPNRVDQLTCPSTTFKKHIQRLRFILFFEIHGYFNCLQAISFVVFY